ncbi:MAG TPA: hypothetical protein VGQ02_09420 [Candidatus Limnocylindrales bacterium]|jgi:uncharacterized membrane protein YeaQ/YmgE (transglycosylase-associated protein family)|nr:hypothetical protein [Candidatus Limnocylindrales bacterium]
MEFNIALGLGAWVLLALGAILFGVAAQSIGEARSGYEWVLGSVGAAFGAIAASEFIVAWRTFEPVWDGLALIPAVVGALVVGVVVDVATRYLTGGTYADRPMSA